MSIYELNEEQLTELKQHYYCERNESVSYGELAEINDLVSFDELVEEYGATYFVEEDFSC